MKNLTTALQHPTLSWILKQQPYSQIKLTTYAKVTYSLLECQKEDKEPFERNHFHAKAI